MRLKFVKRQRMKKNLKKWALLLIMAITLPVTTMAQDKVEASVVADLVSGYIWRGQDLGGVSIQPSISVAYKGLSLTAWGSVGIDGDDDKKVIPGISVAMTKQVVYSKKTGDDKTKGLESPTTLKVAFFSGEIVENLTAAAYYETTFGKEKTKTGDVESDGDEYDGYSFAAGLKYKLAVGEGSITPQFGIAMANNEKNVKANEKQIQWSDKNPKDGEILNIKAGVEFAGYVENTTFTVVYASDNLKADDSTGTLNFTCKIAL